MINVSSLLQLLFSVIITISMISNCFLYLFKHMLFSQKIGDFFVSN